MKTARNVRCLRLATVNHLAIQRPVELCITRALWKMAAAFFALLCGAGRHAQEEKASTAHAEDTVDALVVDGLENGDVFGLGKSVIISGTVKKGVIAFGGDVMITGRVEGDVAAIGGSVFQREGSYIGGDVWVFGGAYHHGKSAPGRNPESTTIMFLANDRRCAS